MSNLQMIKAIRQRTQLPLSTCKQLADKYDTVEAAVAAAVKETGTDTFDKPTHKGRIFIDESNEGVRVIELLCQTDFAANTDAFKKAGVELCNLDITNTNTVLAPLSKKLGESVSIGKTWEYRFTESNQTAGIYVHSDGSVGGVFVLQSNVRGYGFDMPYNVAMHITAMNPIQATLSDIPEKDKRVAEEQTRAEFKDSKKPADIIERIVEGKLNKYYAGFVMEKQPFIKDETMTVGEYILDKAPDAEIITIHRMRAGMTDKEVEHAENGWK